MMKVGNKQNSYLNGDWGKHAKNRKSKRRANRKRREIQKKRAQTDLNEKYEK